MIHPLRFVLAMTMVTAVVSGCFSRSAPEMNYFSLFSMEQMAEVHALANHPETHLGIGPVTTSDILNRPQIVIRNRGNQFVFDDYNRWAGELAENLALVVGNNLGMLLGTQNIDYFPWLPYFVPTYRVVIDLQRLDGTLGGEAVLEVRWSVTSADGKTQLAGDRSVFRRPTTEPGYAGLVRTESQLVADLSREIAAEIDRQIGK